MATFPSVNDLPTSLPQPSAEAQVPRVQLSTTAADTQIAAGAAVSKFGQELGTYGDHLGTLAAQDALIKLREAKGDLTFGPQNGFQNIKGIDVLKQGADGQPMMDSYASRFKTQVEANGKGLWGQAATIYAEKASQETDHFKLELANHQLRQTEVANESVFKSGQVQNITEAARSANDPAALSVVVDRAKKQAEAYAARAGLDPKGLMLSAGSQPVRTAIEAKLAENDAPGAIRLFEAFNGHLDGGDRVVVERAVKAARIGLDAMTVVGGLVGGNVATGEVFGVPEQYRPQVQAAADKYGLPPKLLASTFWNESRWNANARAVGDQAGSVNPATGKPYDSVGLGQWGEQWAQARGFNPADPNASIEQTAKAMREYADKYGGNILLARLAYGWGPANVDKWLASGGDPNKIPEGAKVWLPRTAFGLGDDATSRAAFDRVAPMLKPGVQFKYDAVQETAPIDPTPFVGPQPPTIGAPAARTQPVADTRQMMIDAQNWHINALASMRAKYASDPAMLAATTSLVNVQFEAVKSKIELQKLSLYQSVDDWMTKGGPNGTPATERPPANVWDQLPWEKQRSIDATLAHNAKGKDPLFTDDAKRAWMKLNDLATEDPDTFRKLDLTALIPFMPKDRLEQLQGLRDQISKGGQKEYNLDNALKKADRGLQMMGVDLRPNASDQDIAIRVQMHTALQDWLTRYQTENKRPPKDSEVQQHIDDMLIEGRTARPTVLQQLFGMGDQQGRGAPNAKGATGQQGTMPGGQFSFSVPSAERDKFYVPYKNIPADIRTKIEAAPAMRAKFAEHEAAVKAQNPMTRIAPTLAIGIGSTVRLRREQEVEQAYMQYLHMQQRVPE